jgi:aspartate racemase
LYEASQEQEVDAVPASFAQQRLWFVDQVVPMRSAYNISAALHMRGGLQEAAFERSLHAIVERHEVLRTSFAVSNGHLMQVVSQRLDVPLQTRDLRRLAGPEQEAEVLRLSSEQATAPFDLARGPLLRMLLLRLSSEEHVFLFTIHHIVFDGWSMGVFLQELQALYRATAEGLPSPLPELAVQYADFALWQKEWLQGEVLARELAYWKQQLAGATAVLELPTDRPRPALPTYRGALQRFALSGHLSDQLKGLSRKEGTTLYMTMLAALSCLLCRYSGQEDIVIGSPIAGRSRPETEELIGFFVNTQVLRTDLSGDPTFRELLGRVAEVAQQAQAHQELPFDVLVKELQPQREQGLTPFFQVMMSLEYAPASTSSLDWTLVSEEIATGTAKFDLSLLLEDGPDGLSGCFEYSSDLFEQATVARMAGHFATLLQAVVADPGLRLSQLPLLGEDERRQLLVEWNATEADYPAERCVHELFEEQAERRPEAVALLYEGQQLSYRELNERANQLAHHLRGLGVGPEVLVGLCMERCPEMVVGLLAILKAGGAYVPLDPAYPSERLAFMLADTAAPVLLTQSSPAHMFAAEGVHVLCLDSALPLQEASRGDRENPQSGATAENLAYVMYTSGSTGRPKGVQIRHRSIVRLLFGVGYARLDETRTLLHMAPISFDASTFELWGALLHGARCVLFPERVPTPRSIGRLVQRYRPTTVWLTTALFNAVIDEDPQALLGTEEVLTGGDVLSVPHIRRALELLPSTRLINCYGPTESTTFATSYPIPRRIGEGSRSIPIGRPIGNTQMYILDRSLSPVPVGVVGELYIGGAGLARGYLNRPELTDEKFIDHPFSDRPGEKLYKTGDLVRYLADGTIEFLGRADLQVKIRGFRIELGEIEVVLGQHHGVREALVLAYSSQQGDKRLAAYVVPDGDATAAELRLFLKERLPDYMLPSDFVLVSSIPMTSNGKMDRSALPKPGPAVTSEQDSFVAPTLLVHYQLQRIWQDLLGVAPIGMRDDFFALGGHSLLAARMMDRIEQTCGEKLPLATLFSGATIEHLADAIRRARETRAGDDPDVRATVVTVQAGGPLRPFFFVHGDKHGGGLYCLSLAQGLDPDQPFYSLDPYRFEGLPVPPTLEAMAAAHIGAMRAVQPEGPYLLGGWCNGGLLAYEMGRQLQQAGQRVDLLVAFDMATPYAHRSVRKITSRLGRLIGWGEDRQVDWFLRYLYARIPSFRKKVQEWRQAQPPARAGTRRTRGPIGEGAGGMAAHLFPSVAALRSNWFGIYRWVAASYAPGSYPGKLTLFWSSEADAHQVDWRALSGAREVEDHVVVGTHMMYGNENLHILARQLGTCISRAQAAER